MPCLRAFSLALLAPWARMQSAPQAQQKVDTPMATDERLEAPGWWPTKRSASREDYVGTAECARCHSKMTATQLATPMAHASTPAATSGILREHEQFSRRGVPYSYTITRTETGSTYSVSDGTNSISAPLLWAFGLGNKGQTYLICAMAFSTKAG